MVAETQAPWLSSDNLRWATVIQTSHERAFGTRLFTGSSTAVDSRAHSQELFALAAPVLAHHASNDPLLIYANAAALKLWRRCWSDMVGMPSRLTAPEQERTERAQALSKAQRVDAFQGYRGIRIDSQGRRFVIHNARIWTLWNEHGEACGQAASFSDWWWL